MKRREFAIQIDTKAILSMIDKEYMLWVADSKKDDEQCGAPQDELAEAGYPDLINVIGNNELLNLVVGGYLFNILIGKFSEPTEFTKYWCDEVSNCTYKGNVVSIKGICYS